MAPAHNRSQGGGHHRSFRYRDGLLVLGLQVVPLRREVIDDGLIDGHALACGDLLGIGQPQIVAGWRAMGRPRSVKVGVALYVPVGGCWMRTR